MPPRAPARQPQTDPGRTIGGQRSASTQAGPLRCSIIIPALNEAAQIGQSVERANRLDPFELFVVDGGSTDGTPELAAKAGADVLQGRRGRGPQQNRGAEVATGDVLLFLHADNWLPVVARDQLLAAGDQVGTGGFYQRIEAPQRRYRWLEQGNALRVRWRGLVYGDQALFVRRELFEQVGGFPDVPLMEDVGLMRRLRSISWPILLPGPTYVSPRRWERRGVVPQTLLNWALLSATTLGVSPHRLARYYPPTS